MDQTQLPPAPPPMSPNHTGSNQYEFILNPAQSPKKRLLPGGGSMKQRLLLVAAGVVVLLILFLVVTALLGSAGSAVKQDWQKLVEQQTELIRVSDIGIQKARGKEAKNLATTTKLSLESSQIGLQALASKADAETDAKKIGGRNAQTDSSLTQAEQTNQFDEVFTTLLYKQLRDYQATLKKLYDSSSNDKTKQQLQEAYSNVGVLLSGNQSNGGSS